MVLAQQADIDVVIIVSADSDLTLVADTLNRFPIEAGARVENAAVNHHGKKIINRSFAWSHQIDQKMFERVRDDNDYSRKLDKSDRKDAIARVRKG